MTVNSLSCDELAAVTGGRLKLRQAADDIRYNWSEWRRVVGGRGSGAHSFADDHSTQSIDDYERQLQGLDAHYRKIRWR